MSEMRMVSLPDMHLIVRLNPDGLTCDLVKAFKEERLASEFVAQEARTLKIMGLSAFEMSVLALLKRTNIYMQNKEIVEELGRNRTVVMRALDRLVDQGLAKTAKVGKHRFHFVEGAKEKVDLKPAPAPKPVLKVCPDPEAPKPVNEGVKRAQSTQALIDHFMQNGGQVRRVEVAASGDFFNVRAWLESFGFEIKQAARKQFFIVNGKKMTMEQIFDVYDEERKKRGLEPLRVGGTNV